MLAREYKEGMRIERAWQLSFAMSPSLEFAFRCRREIHASDRQPPPGDRQHFVHIHNRQPICPGAGKNQTTNLSQPGALRGLPAPHAGSQ